MTVSELIKELEKFQKDLPVLVYDHWWDEYETDAGWHENEITIDKDILLVTTDPDNDKRVLIILN